MLERIEEIQGIGLLYQANGRPHTCHKVTLIYGDNGRGKSTLATILRSVSTGSAALVMGYKTIDGTLPPKVVLHFGSGYKVCFETGKWSESRPELMVFDADFVVRNVHSGGLVSTDHRKNLLEFALGEAAVLARKEVEDATSKAKQANEAVKTYTDQLSGFHSGLTLSQFEQLPQVADIDARTTDLQARISAANNIAAIQVRSVPHQLTEPSLGIEDLFSGLALSLEDVHANAETLVRQHIAKLGGRGAENWLSQGRQFTKGTTCPYCDQDILGIELVLAYQTHFNTAYSELKAKIATMLSSYSKNTDPNIIEAFARDTNVVSVRASAWADQVSTKAISFDSDAARSLLARVHDAVVDLLQRKSGAPAEPIGTQEAKGLITALWQQALAPFRATNASIKAAEDLITTYKNKLSNANTLQLQQELQRLQATKCRYEPTPIDLLAKLATTRQAAQQAESKKQAARTKLDTLMTATLATYQNSINSILKKFGAAFSIKDMSANFRGSAPRSEYGILLRGKSVPLEGGPPSFLTALSDGDKRTLAFAFFIASMLDDPKLAGKIVVVDDPLSSLDANRRHQTQTFLKTIHSKAQQLVVLAHDAYFLRDLRDMFWKSDKAAPIAQFQMVASQNGCTAFSQLDIDKECESEYARHHRTLYEYAVGNGGDARSVAKAIRPLLEGYLHRRFPGLLPKDMVFGNVVVMIRDSTSPSPLLHAKNLVGELNEINDYAGQFHHDTNRNADSVPVTAGELKTYVERALCIVHKGAPI